MARKVSTLEEQLSHLADLRAQSPSPEGRAEVTRYLASKTGLVAAKAARIAGEWAESQSDEFVPALVAAFDRFMVKPETDKGCAAKIAILKVLYKLDYSSPIVFRRALRHVQMEPTFGGSVDTAPEVRALGAMGLAQTDYTHALEEILPVLLDPERDARAGAVRAIAASGLPGGSLLLRLKALAGDEPEILGECFAALFRVESAQALEFVASFMDHKDEAIAESAALALGDCRLEEALDILRGKFDQSVGLPLRRTLLVAIALLRREAAIDYLIELVENGGKQSSAEAVAALAMYENDPALQERVARALRSRG